MNALCRSIMNLDDDPSGSSSKQIWLWIIEYLACFNILDPSVMWVFNILKYIYECIYCSCLYVVYVQIWLRRLQYRLRIWTLTRGNLLL